MELNLFKPRRSNGTDSPESTPAVAILGAGVAGLAAAYELSRLDPDMPIAIVEQADRPGGMAQTLTWQGCRLDLGPHRFYTEIPEIDEFVKRIAAGRMLRVKRQSRMWLKGRWLSYPVRPHQVPQALGFGEAFRVGTSALATFLFPPQSQPETYSEYMRKYYGERLSNLLFEPYALKVWGVPPEQLAAETAIIRLRGDTIWHALWDSIRGNAETYVKEFWYPTHGIGGIADGLLEKLRETNTTILLNSELEELTLDPESNRVIMLSIRQEGIKHELAVDAVISTIPLPILTQFLGNALSIQAHAASSQLNYRSLILLYLFFDRDLQINDTWLYVPELDIPFSRISLPGQFDPGCVPSCKTVLTVELPCRFNDERWCDTDHTLEELVTPHLCKMGLVPGKPDHVLAVRLRWGYPTYELDTRRNLQLLFEELATIPNLIATGRQGLFRHNNLDQSIHMGLLAGRQVGRLNERAVASISSDWYANVSQFDSYRIVD